jgi:hypothetical protein
MILEPQYFRRKWDSSNLSWQTANEFFEPWFSGFASRDSISLSNDSFSLSREFHILAMKSHLQAANL